MTRHLGEVYRNDPLSPREHSKTTPYLHPTPILVRWTMLTDADQRQLGRRRVPLKTKISHSSVPRDQSVLHTRKKRTRICRNLKRNSKTNLFSNVLVDVTSPSPLSHRLHRTKLVRGGKGLHKSVSVRRGRPRGSLLGAAHPREWLKRIPPWGTTPLGFAGTRHNYFCPNPLGFGDCFYYS